MPDNRLVLPRILDLDLPFALLDGAWADGPVLWVVAGAALALVGLIALRRVRKIIIVLTVGTAGAVWAWSSGALSLVG